MSAFEQWFKDTFFRAVPPGYAAFLENNPDGLSGEGGSLYRADDVIAYTEERALHTKAVWFIGGRSQETFLMRAADGKIFVVDSTDYTVIDATFSGIDSLLNLMDFDLPT